MVNSTSNTLVRDVTLLFVLAVMWSSSFTAIKIGVSSIPPTTFAMLRVVIGAVVLFGWLKMRRLKLSVEPRGWGVFFLIGLSGNALPFILINWGEQKIASGLAAIIIAAMPLAALILGRIFSDEILNVRRIVGVLVGFSGVVVLIGPTELAQLGDEALRQLAVAVAAVSYAIASILVRKLPPAKPSEHGAGVLIASSILLVPAAAIVDQPWNLNFDAGALAASVYLGVFPTALATIFLIIVVASRGVTFLSLNNYLIPLLGVTWGFLFLSEPITPDIMVALTLILFGVAVAGSGPATRRERA